MDGEFFGSGVEKLLGLVGDAALHDGRLAGRSLGAKRGRCYERDEVQHLAI